MTRNNKDNFLVLILFLISITMIITICSSDSMVVEQSNQAIAQTDLLTNNYNLLDVAGKAPDTSIIQQIIKTEFSHVLKN